MSQQGNVTYYDAETGNNMRVKPTHPDGETRLRFNWNSAINIDPFDSNTIYFGSQFVHKSTDKGLTWTIISDDLTTNDPEKQKRQSTYIEALESIGVKVYYGHYQRGTIECNRCGNIWPTYSEKMTDVNIATQIIIDAYKDNYDMAMLVSGDSDLVPPMKAIHENFKQKRVFVAFPPKRHNSSVSLVAKGSMTIGRKKLAVSQLPNEVQKSDGYMLRKPSEW